MAPDHEAGFPRDQWLDDLVARSLEEDVGAGDVTTRLTVAPGLAGRGRIVAREKGVVAGLPILDVLFNRLDPAVAVHREIPDGTPVSPGQVAAVLEGPVSSLLTGERAALNFLQNLGGIASLTARYVAAVAGTGCRILDTRKTLPGYRHLAKYAVRCGGGDNHRMGLYDRVMLKDNHWAVAGKSLEDLVLRARRQYPGLPVEIEVDDLDQLATVVSWGVEWILLDNFSVADTARAVARRDDSGSGSLLESSGNVDLETVADYAEAGVDAVSIGRLTHSAGALDLGLDLEPL